jgi:AcrR family transcriptional regulator
VTASPKRPYRRADDTRKLVLEVASDLFYRQGIRSVGIDRLAAEAGVTTTTLYRLFGSKDDLVADYLRAADQAWFAWFDGAAGSGSDALPRLFDELDERTAQPGYRGCPFRLALAEYPDLDSPVHRAASENKRVTRARFLEMATAAGADVPELVADQLMVVMDGVCASAADRATSSASGMASAMVRRLLARV